MGMALLFGIGARSLAHLPLIELDFLVCLQFVVQFVLVTTSISSVYTGLEIPL